MDKTTLLLTVPQTAKKLQIGINRAYAMCASNELPNIRIGSTFRIPAAALERWIEAQLDQHNK